MLKKDQVRVRKSGDKGLAPAYVRLQNPSLRHRAGAIMDIFAEHVGRTRGELDEASSQFVKAEGDQKINKGLVELAFQFAQFESVEPERAGRLRSLLYEAGARHFPLGEGSGPAREEILREVALEAGVGFEDVERLMFSDLKEAQVLTSFEGMEEVEFLQRYNLALAQGVLVHALHLDVWLPAPRPERLRQLFRYLKFFRLLFTVDFSAQGLAVRIDGPMSVLKQTRSYGVRLATFLPALLLLDNFSLVADVRWKRRRYTVVIDPSSGLISHYRDRGAWLPEELSRLHSRLEELAPQNLSIEETAKVISLGGRQVYVPDLRLVDGEREAWLEVIWPWKKLKWPAYYKLFSEYAPANAYLCVSTKMVSAAFQKRTNDQRLIYYRATPLADKIIKQIISNT
jgi:uncharacterized protein